MLCFFLASLFVSTFQFSEVVSFLHSDTFEKFKSPCRDSAAVGTKSHLNCSLHFASWCFVLFRFFLVLLHYCGDKKLITPPAFTISSVCFLFPIMQSSSVAILFYAPPAHLRMTERVIVGIGPHYFSSTSLFSFFVLFSSQKHFEVVFFLIVPFEASFGKEATHRLDTVSDMFALEWQRKSFMRSLYNTRGCRQVCIKRQRPNNSTGVVQESRIDFLSSLAGNQLAYQGWHLDSDCLSLLPHEIFTDRVFSDWLSPFSLGDFSLSPNCEMSKWKPDWFYFRLILKPTGLVDW